MLLIFKTVCINYSVLFQTNLKWYRENHLMDFTNFIVEGNKSFNQEKVSRNFACFTRVASKSTTDINIPDVLLSLQ